MPGALLHCPVRETLTVPERAADELTFTEEKRRIDCINLFWHSLFGAYLVCGALHPH